MSSSPHRRQNKDHLDDDLEAENNLALQNLHSKVRIFKSNMEGIDADVREQNRLLDDLEAAFARSRHWFNQGFVRLSSISENPISTRAACYIIAGIVVVFLFLYWLYGGKEA